MHKNLLKNRIEIEIFGVNLKRLIKNLYKNNIDIYDLEWQSFKDLKIVINSSDLKKIKLMLKDYNFKIIARYGYSFLKDFASKRLGLFLLIILFFVMLFFNSNFLGKIYVFGTKQISNDEIITYLQTLGLKQNTFFAKFNLEELETGLENNFSNISLCSVIKKGTSLIINIKEKIDAKDIISSSNIIAKENGKILKLEVVQGTAKFSVGDSVKKGDVIVEGYMENSNKTVECKAIANIEMQVWYECKTTFFEEEKVLERTGKKIENSYYEIFNKRMKMKVKNVNFLKFEKETKTQYLFENLIVPIKIYKEIYYEIKENLIKNDFSLQKDAIIDTIIKQTEKQVPENVEKLNTKIEISDIENGKIITCYIETIQSLS